MAGDPLDEDLEKRIREVIKDELQKHGPSKEGSSERLSRRSFLKMLGLGAGGLALSSQASAWVNLASGSGGDGGSPQSLSGVLAEGNDIGSYDVVDGETTVWDASSSYVPTGALQQIGTGDLSFDPATQSELDSHASSGSAHHTKTQSSDITSANWGDYEIHKNGADDTGIINFKT